MNPKNNSRSAYYLKRTTCLLLAPIPLLTALAGSMVANRCQPVVLGLPFFMLWIVFSVCLCSIVTGLIYLLDPANHGSDGDDTP
mgnify:CR=1 FL=1